MSEQNPTEASDATLDDVIEPHEQAIRHPREHAKADPRPDDDYLQHRTEQERDMVDKQGDQG